MASRTGEPIVVLVDDERMLLRTWRRVLRGLPIQLRCFDRPTLALEAVRTERPAIVVSDAQMPEMSGLALLGEIGREAPGVELVLFTTDGAALALAIRQGFRALDKSEPPGALRTLVEALLARLAPPRS